MTSEVIFLGEHPPQTLYMLVHVVLLPAHLSQSDLMTVIRASLSELHTYV